MARVPTSLQRTAMLPLWETVRTRLDRYGPARRGTISLGRLPVEGEHVVTSLLGRVPARIDLVELESALCDLGVGDDLDGALTALGFPPSPEAEQRRAARAASARTRQAVQSAIAAWPEVWADEWAQSELAGGSFAGLSPAEAVVLVESVQAVVAAVEDRTSLDLPTGWGDLASRTDLAARLFGSAHALDSGTPLGRLSARVLRHALGPAAAVDEDSAAVWERAGFHADMVSFPVLTWGLEIERPSPLAGMADAANRAGIPLPLTQLALRRSPVRLASNPAVVVVENPRLVELAAEQRLPFAVVTTNGNPRRAPIVLVEQLVEGGADVRYHGDFDSAGIGICRSMVDAGCRPIRMDAIDYADACEEARRLGVELPVDDRPAGPTPWDPTLEPRFDDDRRIVHEEVVFLGQLARASSVAALER